MGVFMNKRIILFLILTGLRQCIFAVGSDSDISFDFFTTGNGISQNNVTCITEDSRGFLWFGTRNGLNRFNGYQFEIYQHSNKRTRHINGNHIRCIFEDHAGDLWVGSIEGGLNKLNRQLNTFESFTTSGAGVNISLFDVNTIAEDKNGNLWIGTGQHGIYIIDVKREHIKKKKFDSPVPGHKPVRSIFCDSENNIWIGFAEEGGLYKYTPDHTLNSFVKTNEELNANGINSIRVITEDSEKNVWVGTYFGIFRYNDNGSVIHYCNKGGKQLITNNVITSIAEDLHGEIWIGTENGGVNILNKKTNTFRHILAKENDPKSLNNNSIYAVYCSNSGDIWIGTYLGGINLYTFEKSLFSNYRHIYNEPNNLGHNDVLCFLKDSKNRLWVGTDGGGISIYDSSMKHVSVYNTKKHGDLSLASDNVMSIHEDKEGIYWIATWRGGLHLYNPRKKRTKVLIPDNSREGHISGEFIWSLYEDNDGNMWVGTFYSGLNRYDREHHKFITYEYGHGKKNLSSNNITSILEDYTGDLWIATEKGLNRYDRRTGEFIKYFADDSDSYSLGNNNVISAATDTAGKLWLATADGLCRYNYQKNNFVVYTKENGLPDNVILSIEFDNKNRIWLTTPKGLCLYNPLKQSSYIFPDEYKSTAHYKDNSGLLYFGGAEGFKVFDPDEIKFNNSPPDIVFTNFFISNKEVDFTDKNQPIHAHISELDKIFLPPDVNLFGIEFTSLSLVNSDYNRYEYKLEGFDKDWVYAGNNRIASYSNLHPGEYTFRVRVANGNGVWNYDGKSIDIIIIPPFWKKSWFYLVVILSIIAVIYAVIFLREKKLQHDKKILEDRIARRTKKIEQQNAELTNINEVLRVNQEELANHRNQLEFLVEARTKELERAKLRAEESDRLKSAFLSNMSHEIRTPMNAIIGFSSLLNDPDLSDEEKMEFIRQINTNSESLLVLIDDILDLSKIEANQIQIRKEIIPLNNFMKELFAQWKMTCSKPKVALNLVNKLSEDNILFLSDKIRIRQILNNLLNNAIKFTEEGYINFIIDRYEDKLVFTVEDTGVGIPKDKLGYIFDRFTKINEDRGMSYRGAGLGLAISKRLAEILDGDITVHSNVGTGTVFKFYHPFIEEGIEEQDTVDMKPDKKNIDLKNINILIVEDEKNNFLYLEGLLKRTYANIKWAKDGKEAVSLATNNSRFDIILMDIKMPVLNGFEATRQIKEIYPDQVIIAQTAFAKVDDEKLIRDAGFDDYIAKPINPSQLFSIINNYI
jgi:signal transduction histidine kinase/ligand-binding sensor domain-containing protein/CheY-like chemotaxis protein